MTVAVPALRCVPSICPVGNPAVRNIDLSCAMRIYEPATGLTGRVTQRSKS